MGTDHDNLVSPFRITPSQPADDVVGLNAERLDLRSEHNAQFIVAQPGENVLALEDLNRRDPHGVGGIPALRDTDPRDGDEYRLGPLLAGERCLTAWGWIDVRSVGVEILWDPST